MIRTLLGQVGEYKRASLLTPLFTGLEVVMEATIENCSYIPKKTGFSMEKRIIGADQYLPMPKVKTPFAFI